LIKTVKTQTRLILGAYDFTADVVAVGNKAGRQFGIEQPAGKRLTLAADWFTGHHTSGYFTPGVGHQTEFESNALQAYEIGNSAAAAGNRLLILQLGWNFN
jgi:hypothetical protein